MDDTTINDIKYLEGREFLREKVRIRDNHTCQKCKKKWQRGSRRFDVHHLDPHLEGDEGRKYRNNPIDKMITLCHSCHLKLPEVRQKMKVNRKGYKYRQVRNKHIRQLRRDGLTLCAIGQKFNLNHTTISDICIGVDNSRRNTKKCFIL
jgi:hypothetical protein